MASVHNYTFDNLSRIGDDYVELQKGICRINNLEPIVQLIISKNTVV